MENADKTIAINKTGRTSFLKTDLFASLRINSITAVNIIIATSA